MAAEFYLAGQEFKRKWSGTGREIGQIAQRFYSLRDTMVDDRDLGYAVVTDVVCSEPILQCLVGQIKEATLTVTFVKVRKVTAPDHPEQVWKLGTVSKDIAGKIVGG